MKKYLILLTSIVVFNNANAFDIKSIFSMGAGSKSVGAEEDNTLQNIREPNCTVFSPWGNPKIKDDNLMNRSVYLCRTAYSVQYDAYYKSAVWASEVLTKNNVTKKPPEGIVFKGFSQDPNISEKSQIKVSDYNNTAYVPGPLVSINNLFVYYPQYKKAQKIEINQKSIDEGFFITGSMPMTKKLRDGFWNTVSSQARISFGKSARQQLYIISGPLYLNGKTLGMIGGKNGVPIPTHYFKVIVDPDTSGSLSYIFPNENLPDNVPLQSYVVGVKEVERLSGFVFFPKLAPYYSMKVKLDVNEYIKEKDDDE